MNKLDDVMMILEWDEGSNLNAIILQRRKPGLIIAFDLHI